MTIPITIHEYLNRAGVPYDVKMHKRTACALDNAHAAHVPSETLAKAVLLRCPSSYVLAIIPASHQVRLEKVGNCINHPVCLATEMELSSLFDDCAPGAIPALGEPYDVRTIIDDRLEGLSDVFFEGGDHYSLVHIAGHDFDELMDGCFHADISTRH